MLAVTSIETHTPIYKGMEYTTQTLIFVSIEIATSTHFAIRVLHNLRTSSLVIPGNAQTQVAQWCTLTMVLKWRNFYRPK